MKLSTKRNAIASALALTGLFMYAGSAQADTVRANQIARLYNSTGGGVFTFTRTGGDAPQTLLPNTQLAGNAALDFIGICLEFNESLDATGSDFQYNLVNLEAAPNNNANSPDVPMNTRANDMRLLLGGVYPVFGGSINGLAPTGIRADALQLAVWEISLEGQGATYDLTTGNFTFASNPNGARDTAQGWLHNINSGNLLGWQPLTNLKAITYEGKQDFAVQVVPIPAAAWLFGSAILGTVALGRRKLKEGAEA